MKQFMYRFIGSGNAYGPVRAESLTAAKKKIRALWIEDFRAVGQRCRFECWETSPIVGQASYHAQYAAE